MEVHKELFEGFAYCILNKLGNSLYLCVFGEARASSIEQEIMRSNAPDDIEDVATPAALPAAEELGMRKANLQAPYLIHLLTRLMTLAPSHLGAAINARAGKSKAANSKGSMKGALAVIAKDRLQRTLVTCMFGTEGVDSDDTFMDCLKMPTAMKEVLPMPKVKEVEVQEWFGEEVWRLLGWEVLGKEGGW